LLFLKQEQWKKGKKSKGTFKGYWYNNPSNFDIKPEVNHFLSDNLNPIETIDYQLAFNQDNFNIFQISIKPEFLKVNKFSDVVNFFSKFENQLENLVSRLNKIKSNSIYNNESIDHNFEKVIERNNLNLAVKAKFTLGDGNCFYRSISYQIFGNDDFWFIIKISIIFIIYKYKFIFQDFLNNNINSRNIEELILFHFGQNVWADETIQAATAFCLKRDLLVYSVDCSSLKPFKILYKMFESELMPLLIGYDNYHFVPFLILKNSNVPKSNSGLDVMMNLREDKRYNISF
jgi:hypothetical protein